MTRASGTRPCRWAACQAVSQLPFPPLADVRQYRQTRASTPTVPGCSSVLEMQQCLSCLPVDGRVKRLCSACLLQHRRSCQTDRLKSADVPCRCLTTTAKRCPACRCTPPCTVYRYAATAATALHLLMHQLHASMAAHTGSLRPLLQLHMLAAVPDLNPIHPLIWSSLADP